MNQCYLPFLLIANNFICCEDHIDMCVRVLKAGTIARLIWIYFLKT